MGAAVVEGLPRYGQHKACAAAVKEEEKACAAAVKDEEKACASGER